MMFSTSINNHNDNYKSYRFLALTTLLLSTSSHVSDAALTKEVMSDNHYYRIRTSFVVRSNVDTMTLDEQQFAADCLRHSFDAAYEFDDKATSFQKAGLPPTDQVLSLLRLPSVTSNRNENPTTTNKDSSEQDSALFQWVVEWNTLQATCPRCHVIENTLWVHAHDTLTVDYHKRWEASFCATLRNGQLDIFRDTDSCHIALQETKETGKVDDTNTAASTMVAPPASASKNVSGRRQVVFKVRASLDVPSDDEMNDEELDFTNDALRVSYNEIHQREGIIMERVTLNEHYTVPDDNDPPVAAAAIMLRGSWDPDQWMDFTMILSWEVSVVCRFCALESNSNNNDTFHALRAFMSESNNDVHQSALTLHKAEQDRWEEALCQMLRASPFETLKLIKSCAVVIYMDN